MTDSTTLLRGLKLTGYRSKSGDPVPLGGVYISAEAVQLRVLSQFLAGVAERIELGELFNHDALLPFGRYTDVPNVVVLHPHVGEQEESDG